MRAIVFRRGRRAVHRFEWAADGAWSVVDALGVRSAPRLAAATSVLGPWILLAWSGDGGRRYALVDAAGVGPVAFRALKGRLALTGWRIPAARRGQLLDSSQLSAPGGHFPDRDARRP